MSAATGISGFAAYLPPNQVELAEWCRYQPHGADRPGAASSSGS